MALPAVATPSARRASIRLSHLDETFGTGDLDHEPSGGEGGDCGERLREGQMHHRAPFALVSYMKDRSTKKPSSSANGPIACAFSAIEPEAPHAAFPQRVSARTDAGVERAAHDRGVHEPERATTRRLEGRPGTQATAPARRLVVDRSHHCIVRGELLGRVARDSAAGESSRAVQPLLP